MKLPFVTQLIQTKVVYIWSSLLQLTVESCDLSQPEKVAEQMYKMKTLLSPRTILSENTLQTQTL